jgi:S1-C subfamily serine protease
VRKIVVAALAAAVVLVGRSSAAPPPTTGVVNIQSVLGYQQDAAAGTGIVLTSNGYVVTNNHVIRGATRVRVTVPSTRRTFSATVLGYSLAADVALLRLANASGLRRAPMGNSSTAKIGDFVTAVGNAGGKGGTPMVTTGQVTGLHASISVSDDQGGTAHLADLLEINAFLQPGDSGGPLLDSNGRVIGMDAAVESGVDANGGSNGYSIPINRVLSVVRTVEAGRSTSTVHVGPTSFLGISVGQGAANGALVSGVLSGGPAARAGLVSGDVITAVAGHRVTSPHSLIYALLGTSPGRAILVRWRGGNGTRHSGSVRPEAGPPQ